MVTLKKDHRQQLHLWLEMQTIKYTCSQVCSDAFMSCDYTTASSPLTFEMSFPAAVRVSTVLRSGYMVMTCRNTLSTSPKHSWACGRRLSSLPAYIISIRITVTYRNCHLNTKGPSLLSLLLQTCGSDRWLQTLYKQQGDYDVTIFFGKCDGLTVHDAVKLLIHYNCSKIMRDTDEKRENGTYW